MSTKLERSNSAHERLADFYNDKKVQLKIKSRDRRLSDKELKKKNMYECKERYHKHMIELQDRYKAVMPKCNRPKVFNKIYHEYF
jgi:hypothetical protein